MTTNITDKKGMPVAEIARLSLGAVWLYQGIIPKLLLQMDFELDIVARSNLYLYSPKVMLFLVGLLEASIGLWILSGYRARFGCFFATAFMMLMEAIVVVIEPSLLVGPFGGLTKNIGLIALAWIVWRDGAEIDAWRTQRFERVGMAAWQALLGRRCVVSAIRREICGNLK